MSPRFVSITIGCVATFMAASLFANDAPLHEKIDSILGVGDAEFEKGGADLTTDAEFARRLYLDLTGVIPSAKQARAFLEDRSPSKRVDLIDQLLASPLYARRMQYAFDRMLMEQRPSKHVKAESWQRYLRQAFAKNKPWDVLVREMLAADGADEKTRPAARFMLDREMKMDQLTRDLGRMFLGRDLQCAQCHDHPTVDDYLQRHYHGIAAFLNRSYLFTDKKSKKTSIGEKAEGVVKFTSVFTNESGQTAPRLLDLPAIADPPKSKEPYQVKPAKNVRSVPSYSRRLQLAQAMVDHANIDFRRNIANRLWAMMMGRGIVDPVDMIHSGNPPSHPKLLDLLGDALAERCFDMQWFLRELAQTNAYQRSSRHRAEDEPSGNPFNVAQLKPLTPEQLAWSMMQATGKIESTTGDASKVESQLKKHVVVFVDVFGVVGVQTSQFDASANQALFLRNNELVQTWLSDLAKKLTPIEAPKLAEEFYLRFFSRPATAKETKQFDQFLRDHKENREAAIKQLAWAALASDAFRFNH